jgi:N-methylhydantoinase B
MMGLLDRSERMARAEIAAMPDGEYSFEDWLDNDGMDGPPQKLQVTVRIQGEELTADFTGTDMQAPTAINSPLAYSRSAFYLAVRSIMSQEIPNTAGFFRSLHMIAPEGTLVNPSFPAAVGAMGVVGYRLADTIFGALAQAVPHLVRAASEGGTTRYTVGATKNGHPSILSEALVGAWGGHPRMDGVDGVANVAANMANSPVEMVESTYPVIVEEYGFEIDSEGAGKFRGGLGVRRKVHILAPEGGMLQVRSGRADHPPWGLHGGKEGTTCQNILNPGKPKEKKLLGNETLHVPSGTTFLHVTPGAGGFGPPEERDMALVAHDVRDGKISVQRAREVYKVEVDEDGHLDDAGTKRLREN